ncbi:IS66 family insertion sequence element accessory protein TnpA [Marinomonas algicola]|uniref:IS66 family insertion sequence element accessory protein TnpA n=1 Tax=Marinomonas algicola TaxID=2773454 RepID=UPI003B84A6FC
MIDNQAQSDLSAPQYCEQHHINYFSFSKWRQHFSSTKTSTDSTQPDFIDLSHVSTLSGSERWNITLCLGDGIELRLSRE